MTPKNARVAHVVAGALAEFIRGDITSRHAFDFMEGAAVERDNDARILADRVAAWILEGGPVRAIVAGFGLEEPERCTYPPCQERNDGQHECSKGVSRIPRSHTPRRSEA